MRLPNVLSVRHCPLTAEPLAPSGTGADAHGQPRGSYFAGSGSGRRQRQHALIRSTTSGGGRLRMALADRQQVLQALEALRLEAPLPLVEAGPKEAALADTPRPRSPAPGPTPERSSSAAPPSSRLPAALTSSRLGIVPSSAFSRRRNPRQLHRRPSPVARRRRLRWRQPRSFEVSAAHRSCMTPHGAKQPVDLDPARSVELDPDQIGAVTQNKRQEARLIPHRDSPRSRPAPHLAWRDPSYPCEPTSNSIRW